MDYDDTRKSINWMSKQPLDDKFFDKAARIKLLLILLDIAETLSRIDETYAEADARNDLRGGV